MKFIEDVKLKTGVWLRERKEKAEAKRALHAAASSEHGHGRFFLLHVPATATIFAAIVEIYWAFLFCIEATGHLLLDFSTAVGEDHVLAIGSIEDRMLILLDIEKLMSSADMGLVGKD